MSGDIVHMFWRCHNRSNLLVQKKIKEKILELYFKYKDQFGIEIIDFQNLDNHSHWILRIKNAKLLGDFTRIVHSQIAAYVNKLLNRDSQVIRERYKSPAVRDEKYLQRVIGYVLLNRFKVDKSSRPESDPFCSAYHRLNKTKYSDKLVQYSDLGLCSEDENTRFLKRLVKYFITQLVGDLLFFDASNFVNQLIVGSQSTIENTYREILARKNFSAG